MYKALRKLTVDNAAQQRRLTEARALINEKIAELEETIGLRRDKGFKQAEVVVLSGRGKASMDKLRVVMASFMATEEQLLQQRQQEVELEQAKTDRLLTLVTIGLITLFLLLILLLFRSTVLPIRRIAEVARRYGQGENIQPLPMGSRDEVGDLAAEFNAMIALRQQAVDSLNRQTAQMSRIVENMVDGLVTINERGIVQSFNRAAEDIFGYRVDEVIGENVKMLMPEPYHSGHDGYLRHYLTTGEKKIIGIGRQVQGKRRDGSIFPMNLAVSESIQQGDGRLFVGIIRDISQQKQAEDAMAAKNREIALRNRYESSFGSIVSLYSGSFDQQEMLIGTLDVLARQHPYPVSAIYLYDEWSGQLELVADHGIPKALPQSFALGEGVLGQVIRDGKTVILDEMDGARILPIDAGLVSFVPAAVIIVPVHFQDRPLAVLALASSKPLVELDQVFIDRLAGQIGVALNNLTQHQALSDLAEQLRTSSDEIREQNVQLEKASRLKSEFLANMSHELRTPLNAIIGFSEVLKDGVIGELEKDQVEYVTDIFTSGKHLLSLINDILDLSKIEAGKMELDMAPVNVTDILRNSVSIIKEKAASHRIQLDCDFGVDVGTCYMDGRKVKQMIYNLLSNAVKFTPDGGLVCVAARRVSREALGVSGAESGVRRVEHEGSSSPLTPDVSPVSSPISDAAEFLEISISDTGIGISAEDQERLFQPFQQLESSLTKTFEGTGLGLVMVRRLAEMHGGTVGLHSKSGEGSTFAIWLPFLQSEEQAVATADRAADESESRQNATDHPQTVLIVEDDAKAAQLMRLQLEDAGYTTRHAISAEQALEMLEEEQPDLITLDIMLPGMDGWDFMQMLNLRENMGHIPVVVVSIVADSDKGFSLGAADVLQKPVRRQALLGAIGKLGFSLEGKRVLVVDDDPKAVELLSRHLASVGCGVLKAYGGKEAIEIATSAQPDLIILDLMMPRVSGFDVVEKLKKIPMLAGIPIMILTAKLISETDRRRLNGDIVKIMQKSSFNHGNFINEVKRATHKRKTRSSL